MDAEKGDTVKVLGGKVEPGHGGNLYPWYVFVEPVSPDENDRRLRRGWVPVQLLQAQACCMEDEGQGQNMRHTDPSDPWEMFYLNSLSDRL